MTTTNGSSTSPSSTGPSSTSAAQGTGGPKARGGTRWRPVDIVVASVLGVAGGLLFILWNIAGEPLRAALGFYPPLGALTYGFWVLPGVLVGLVVRKPGAALYGEVLAAVVSMLVGNQWGFGTLNSGIIQGLGAELVFALLLYRRWGLGAALGAGAGAGLGMGIYETLVYNAALAPTVQLLYAGACVVSGIVLAGGGSWLVLRGLQSSGALSALASGRTGQRV